MIQIEKFMAGDEIGGYTVSSSSNFMVIENKTQKVQDLFIFDHKVEASDFSESSETIDEYNARIEEEINKALDELNKLLIEESLMDEQTEAQLEMQANIQYLVDLAEINEEGM